MSFFDDASLIYLAKYAASSASIVSGSGTGTGKTYSIKPIDGGFDLSLERGSDITATRVDSSGLIEKGRTNIILDSNDFSTGNYTRSGGTTVTPNQPGFDGTNSATLYEAPDGGDRISQNISPSLDSGVFTISLFASRSSGDCDLRFRLVESGGSPKKLQQAFNLATGVPLTAVGDTDAFIAASSSDAGNGYKRISLTLDPAQLDNLAQVQLITTAIGANSTNKDGTVSIQNLQLEAGLVPTNYIDTGATRIRAGLLEDEPRFDYHNSASVSPNTCPSLLLEPSRTNLVTFSEYFSSNAYSPQGSVTVITNTSSISSPQGVENTAFLKSAAADSEQFLQIGSLSVSNTEDYVLSVFAKKRDFDFLQLKFTNADSRFNNAGVWFNINTGVVGTADSNVTGKIEDYGNGWFRCIATATATSTGAATVRIQLADADNDNDTNGDGIKGTYLYGAMFEESSFATSYIPTNGTAATRGGDICASGQNLPEALPTSHTYFFELKRLVETSATNEEIIIIKNSSSPSNNKITLSSRSNGVLRALIAGNSDTIGLSSSNNSFDQGETIKAAVRITPDLCTLFVNGSSAATSSDIGNVTGINNITSIVDVLVNQIVIFPSALSDNDCETLTTL